jgi:hypothetical protein
MMASRTAAVFCMPEQGHFERLLGLIGRGAVIERIVGLIARAAK